MVKLITCGPRRRFSPGSCGTRSSAKPICLAPMQRRRDVARPLNKRLSQASLERGTGHAGLWYDKFCDRWSGDWKLDIAGDGQSRKLEWIETVTKQPAGTADALEESTSRLLRLVIA